MRAFGPPVNIIEKKTAVAPIVEVRDRNNLPVAQATILEDTWEVSGLVGTGSHDFTLEQVFVPEAYTWRFGPGMPRGQHYQGGDFGRAIDLRAAGGNISS